MQSLQGDAPLTAERQRIWPLLLAPLVAGVYYLSLRYAFSLSLASVIRDASDVNLSIPGSPTWGSHWIYRSFTEVVSVPFGAFVAAGIAQQRAKLAGIIGGLTISLGYLLRNVLLVFVYLRPNEYNIIEPWYQHVIEGFIIVGAPFAGAGMGDYAQEFVRQKPEGFAGINRWHFLWLWFAAMAYAAGIISPFLHLWIDSFIYGEFGFLGDAVHWFVFGVPVLTYMIPGVWGLNVLAHESKWSRSADNMIGPAILVIGWFLATAIVFGWGLLVTFILKAIFG